MLAPQQCYDAVVADCTYTILLTQESETDIDNELPVSAMDIGIEATEQGRFFETQGLKEELRIRSSCGHYTHGSSDSKHIYSATIVKVLRSAVRAKKKTPSQIV